MHRRISIPARCSFFLAVIPCKIGCAMFNYEKYSDLAGVCKIYMVSVTVTINFSISLFLFFGGGGSQVSNNNNYIINLICTKICCLTKHSLFKGKKKENLQYVFKHIDWNLYRWLHNLLCTVYIELIS